MIKEQRKIMIPPNKFEKVKELVKTEIENGDFFFKSDNYEDAITSYKNAVSYYNNYSGDLNERLNLYVKIAECYSKRGDYKNAISYYHKILSKSSKTLRITELIAAEYNGWDNERTLEYYVKSLNLGADEGYFTSAVWLMMKNKKFQQKHIKFFCEKWADKFRIKYLEKMPAFSHSKGDKNKKLNIAYVSTDFYCHAMMSFILPILENHDTSKYNFTLYYLDSKNDFVTKRIKETGMNFVDLPDAGPQEIAKRIYDDKIDIVVDLAGYINTKTFWLFYKPAPIQMQYLGFLNTYGMKELDYIIADEFSIPPEIAGEYTEKPMYLKHGMQKYCFSAPKTKFPPLSLLPPVLKNDYITFGSFNTISKIDNATIALWVRLLESVPNSRLLFYRTQMTDKDKDGIIKLLRHNNADMDRIIFKNEKMPDSHFNIYSQADIALDPLPFSGLTVTIETLLMGVPVLTLAGDTLQSKGTARINKFLGLNSLVAKDEDDFIEKAKQIAQPREIAKFRMTLRQIVMNSDLFNNYSDIARDFEECFDRAWKDYCKFG